MRIKITNKKPFVFEDTIKGLKILVEKLEEAGIPDDAQIYFRTHRLAEVMWSSLDDT